MSRRHYDQYCGLAHGLDLIGERWTLLIARDLLPGPQRYRDLANRQPGIASDMLTARLKMLTEQGMIERIDVPGAGRTKEYRLTERGDELLRPVIEAIVRFGMPHLPSPGTTDERLEASWALLTLSIFLGDTAPDDAGVMLRTETGTSHLHHTPDGLRVSYTPPHEPAVTLTGTTEETLGILFGRVDVNETSVEISGSTDALDRWRQAVQTSAPPTLTSAHSAAGPPPDAD